MDDYRITQERIAAFGQYLRQEERCLGTIEKYLRDVRSFAAWLDGAPVNNDMAVGWKEHLWSKGFCPVTINSMLAAVNSFFHHSGWNEHRMRYLKIQRKMFRDSARELTRADYTQLLETARTQGRERLALLMETICATGIRVSELKYITVQAASKGKTEISLKGKIRTILLSAKLCRKLLKYAKKQKIASGEIFLTKSGKSLTRKQIWAEMKALCEKAGIASTKVFPHNLRHLFARTYYKVCRDIAQLADVLGHSSIETTRIYLVSTGVEYAKQLERLGLVS